MNEAEFDGMKVHIIMQAQMKLQAEDKMHWEENKLYLFISSHLFQCDNELCE